MTEPWFPEAEKTVHKPIPDAKDLPEDVKNGVIPDDGKILGEPDPTDPEVNTGDNP